MRHVYVIAVRKDRSTLDLAEFPDIWTMFECFEPYSLSWRYSKHSLELIAEWPNGGQVDSIRAFQSDFPAPYYDDVRAKLDHEA